MRINSREHKSREIRKITVVGMLCNFLLSAVKFVAGSACGSQTIIADSVHSLSDSVTDITVLVGVRFWSKPPDRNHPHGHAKIENIVSVIIAALLVMTGIGMGYKSLATLREPDSLNLRWFILPVVLVSITVKEILYRWTSARSRKLRSPALAANAWHHRSDALSSVPAALAVLGAVLVPTWNFLDHVGGAVVSLFIIGAAWRIVKPAFGKLIDAAAPAEIQKELERIAISVDGVAGVHSLRTRFMGGELQVDMHIEVDGGITVEEGFKICLKVEETLTLIGPGVADVLVRCEPHLENKG